MLRKAVITLRDVLRANKLLIREQLDMDHVEKIYEFEFDKEKIKRALRAASTATK